MRTYEIPDLPDSPPDDDEPAEGARVKCWHCNGYGRTSYGHPDHDRPIGARCEACGGTGYTHETTEDEDTEEDENED